MSSGTTLALLVAATVVAVGPVGAIAVNHRDFELRLVGNGLPHKAFNGRGHHKGFRGSGIRQKGPGLRQFKGHRFRSHGLRQFKDQKFKGDGLRQFKGHGFRSHGLKEFRGRGLNHSRRSPFVIRRR